MTKSEVVGYDQLTLNQIKVLKLLIQDDEIRYEEIASLLGVKSKTSIQKHIDGLKNAGTVSSDQAFEGKWVIHYDADL